MALVGLSLRVYRCSQDVVYLVSQAVCRDVVCWPRLHFYLRRLLCNLERVSVSCSGTAERCGTGLA